MGTFQYATTGTDVDMATTSTGTDATAEPDPQAQAQVTPPHLETTDIPSDHKNTPIQQLHHSPTRVPPSPKIRRLEQRPTSHCRRVLMRRQELQTLLCMYLHTRSGLLV